MNVAERTHRQVKTAVWRLAASFVAAILATAMIVLTAPGSAQATRQLTRGTGLPCGQCHEEPTGGALNDFGKGWRPRPLGYGPGGCNHGCWRGLIW
jgi:hypothetical protein